MRQSLAPGSDHSGPGPASLRPPRWVLPVATGVLLALSFRPARIPLLPFVALVPLLVSLDQGGGDPRWPGRAGWIAGCVAWTVLMSWVPVTLSSLTALAVPLFVIVVVLLAGFTALAAWATQRLRLTLGWPLWLAAPVAWGASEWLRAHLGPLSFPWLELGVTLAANPVLAGPAELVGVRGLGFWLAAVSGLVATALISVGRRRFASVVGAGALVVAPALWSAARLDTMVLKPLARVAVVQPNVSRDARAGAEGVRVALDRLQDLHPLISPGVDLALWPEATFTEDPRADPSLGAEIGALVDRVGVPVLLGAYLREPTSGGGSVTSNGALLWLPGGGDAGYVYRKRRLVPGFEAIPFINPERPGVSSRFAAFARGTDRGVLTLPGLPALSPLICYESIFSQDGRSGEAAGGLALVNLTNDAWFATEGGTYLTSAFHQHPAHLVLRAIELRQGAVRAANTGVSMFVSPTGRIQSSAPTYSGQVLEDTLFGTQRPTLFARFGDWLATASLLAAGLGLFSGWWRRREPEG